VEHTLELNQRQLVLYILYKSCDYLSPPIDGPLIIIIIVFIMMYTLCLVITLWTLFCLYHMLFNKEE